MPEKAGALPTIKVTSFNTLYYAYSGGGSSFYDQTELVRKHINQENPDVCALLEMPKPFFPVEEDNLALAEAISDIENWLSEHGYIYQKKLDETLSVWVVSKYPLIPLLLLGASKVHEALRKVFGRSGIGGTINSRSSYIECASSMSDFARALMLGVVIQSEGSTWVLPFIATHAPCRYYNHRFGRLYLHMLRAVVAESGLVVGDFNIHVGGDPEDIDLCKDPVLRRELNSEAADALLKLPTGKLSVCDAPGVASATQLQYPFEPLNIDGVLAPTRLAVKTCVLPDTVLPNRAHLSDHRWISVTVNTNFMIPCPRETTSLSKMITREWCHRHPDLYKLFLHPLNLTPPLAGSQSPVPPVGSLPERQESPAHLQTVPLTRPDSDDGADSTEEEDLVRPIARVHIPQESRPPDVTKLCPFNRIGMCTRNPCKKDSHVRCPRGDACSDSMCIMGHSKNWSAAAPFGTSCPFFRLGRCPLQACSYKHITCQNGEGCPDRNCPNGHSVAWAQSRNLCSTPTPGPLTPPSPTVVIAATRSPEAAYSHSPLDTHV